LIPKLSNTLTQNALKKAKYENLVAQQKSLITAIFNSYGNRQISTPYKINTPEPIDRKIGKIDYIREGTSYTKYGRNLFTGDSGQMGEI